MFLAIVRCDVDIVVPLSCIHHPACHHRAHQPRACRNASGSQEAVGGGGEKQREEKRKKKEGRRKKEEGRRKKGEGRKEKEEVVDSIE